MAHYHSNGLVRTDTMQLLKEAHNYFDRVIVVSTNFNQSFKCNLPAHVELYSRENIGYDFYSYRYGLNKLMENSAAWEALDEVCLLNSSFLCFDAKNFFENLLKNELSYKDAFGLVKSHESTEHIQSYVVVLKSNILKNQILLNWWDSMKPINERQGVIENYEIGLSRLIIKIGGELNAAFNHFSYEPNVSIRPDAIEDKLKTVEYINNYCNPSHFHWKNLLDNFSIIKIEVIKSNPFKMDIKPFVELINKNKRYSEITLEGLSN